MSNGSGSIIIRQLIENEGASDKDRKRLREIYARYSGNQRCSVRDALFIQRFVWRLIR